MASMLLASKSWRVVSLERTRCVRAQCLSGCRQIPWALFHLLHHFAEKMGCVYCVQQSEVAICESWGRYADTHYPGIHCLVPCKDNVAGRLTLRTRELHIRVETKTKDNVFVNVTVTIMFKVLEGSLKQAFYELSMPDQQLQSYVLNNVRAQIPKYELDQLFVAKDEIAKTLKTELEHEMNQFGYTIVQTLITDIDPDHTVKRAMNEINAAQRLRVAAHDKAEAEKLAVVKAAEADAESKRLSGVGLAEQRKAIILGLHDSIRMFTSNTNITQMEVMELLLMNQYFDTLKEMTAASKATTVFIPHNPDAVNNIGGQIRQGLLEAGQVVKKVD